MNRPDGIRIGPGLVLPEAELDVKAVRASGPGGQAVNKVSTKVVLRFSIPRSAVLTPEQKARLLTRLAARLTGEGVLLVQASRLRERSRNEREARERLGRLVADALAPERARVRTRPTGASRRRRLDSKRRRSETKRGRRATGDE